MFSIDWHYTSRKERKTEQNQGIALFWLRSRVSRYFKDSLIHICNWIAHDLTKQIIRTLIKRIIPRFEKEITCLVKTLILEIPLFLLWATGIDSNTVFTCIHFSKLYLLNFINSYYIDNKNEIIITHNKIPMAEF